jgi:AsmA-like protein
VQTTLLGLAVAIILALVTALVGPLLVDWGRWRTSFEAEATRLVGMPVRVSGPIDARLLPTPSLSLNGIEIGEPGRDARLRARALRVEFSLAPLMRGEWRAAQLHIEGPQVAIGIDADGRVEVPQVAIAFDPDQLSFEQVDIEDGRAVLLDAASGTRAVLDQLWFKGDVRSLLGPFKGEGAFVSSGQLYGYRIAGSRRGDDGGMRLRLSVNPSDQPLTVETDGTLSVEAGRPRYEGTLTLARPAGFVLSSGKTVASEPWRATAQIKATPAGARFEQVELRYGPDDRAIKLGGTAELKLGTGAGFDAVLSARQVDVDRAVLLPDGAPRTPVALLRHLTDSLSELGRPSMQVKIGVGVDAVTLGGAALIGLRGDIRFEAGVWSLDSIEFRAPGSTQVRASGRLTLAPGAAGFAGPASLDSADPRVLIAWLEGRPESPRAPIGALRARGDVSLGPKRLAVEDLKAQFDGRTIEGRLAYDLATDARPPRLDAKLSAATIDLDGALAFAGNALAGTSFERPRDIALELDFGRSTYAGVEAKGATAKLKFDAAGLDIERLAIADFGGAVLNGSGRIDTTSPSWRGSIALSLEARQLTGVAALAAKFAKFAPGAADILQAMTRRAASAKLDAKLDVAPASDAADAKTSARLTLKGTMAGVRIDMHADGLGDVGSPATAELHLGGRLDADDGANLVGLLGLARVARVDHRAASLVLSANGPAGGDLQVDAKLAGAGLDAGARGTLRLGDAQPHGALDVTVAAADARLPRRDPAAAVPVTLTAHLSIDGDRLTVDALDGKVASAQLKGRIALVLGNPAQADGHLDVDALDAAGVIAAAIGAPAAAHAGTAWSAEPFGVAPLADVAGRIDFSIARADFAGIVGTGLHGTVRIEPAAIRLEALAGIVGEGRLAAQAEFRAGSSGRTANMQVSLDNADLAMLMPRAARVMGRVSLQFDAIGTGLSPAALIGALQGSGSAAAESLQVAALDPGAIDAAAQAAEHGVLLDPVRVGDVVRAALDNGGLDVPDIGGTVAIHDGRLTFAPLAAPARGADVTLRGSYDLGLDALDLGLDLTGAPRSDAPSGQRPQLSILFKGPVAAPRRSVDVTALVNWLTLRRVERAAKRLEAAEEAARRIQAQEAEALRRAQEAAALAAKRIQAQQDAEALRRAQEAAVRAAQQPALPSTFAAPAAEKAAEKAPDLPPVIEIIPTPGAAASKPHRAPPARRAQSAPALPPPLVITPQETRPEPR